MSHQRQALIDLYNVVCACGGKKLLGRSFCNDCLHLLPQFTQRDLHKPFSDGYADTYAEARKALEAKGRLCVTNIICRCDVCGREKGETNHWFAVWTADEQFNVRPWGANPHSQQEHICGQECLHKRLSQWLEANKS